MKRIATIMAAAFTGFFGFGVATVQSKASEEQSMSIECGLAVYHALQSYDASLRKHGSSIIDYVPKHSNRISCTSEGDAFLIVSLWNDPPMLGGSMTYKLSKADYSILEAVPER